MPNHFYFRPSSLCHIAVEEAVGRINGRIGQIGCPVVHYVHRAVPKDALRKYYRLADVMPRAPRLFFYDLVTAEALFRDRDM